MSQGDYIRPLSSLKKGAAMTTLMRSPQSCPPSEALEFDEAGFDVLSQDAHKLLGYQCRPTQEIQERSTTIRCNEIRAALRELPDPPFVTASVEKYKRRMARKVIPLGQRISFALEKIACRLLILAAVSLVCWILVGVGVLSSTSIFWQALLVCLASAAVCGVGSVLACESHNEPDGTINYHLVTVEWVAYPIRDYRKLIPEFALQTAVDLKRRFPELNFFVEEIVVSKEKKVLTKIFDPFLYCDLPDGSRYYLEVWDEPKFIQKRQS